MAFATREQLLEIEDIRDYESVVDINSELQRAENQILRFLRTTWWQSFQIANPQLQGGQLDPQLLSTTEWSRPTIYWALAYVILPKLPGNWLAKIAEYHQAWEYEIRTLRHHGITYDPLQTTLRFVPETERFNYTRLRK